LRTACPDAGTAAASKKSAVRNARHTFKENVDEVPQSLARERDHARGHNRRRRVVRRPDPGWDSEGHHPLHLHHADDCGADDHAADLDDDAAVDATDLDDDHHVGR